MRFPAGLAPLPFTALPHGDGLGRVAPRRTPWDHASARHRLWLAPGRGQLGEEPNPFNLPIRFGYTRRAAHKPAHARRGGGGSSLPADAVLAFGGVAGALSAFFDQSIFEGGSQAAQLGRRGARQTFSRQPVGQSRLAAGADSANDGRQRTWKGAPDSFPEVSAEFIYLGSPTSWIIIWRRERFEPRTSRPVNGFQDHRLKPLGHPSAERLFKALCPRMQQPFRPQRSQDAPVPPKAPAASPETPAPRPAPHDASPRVRARPHAYAPATCHARKHHPGLFADGPLRRRERKQPNKDTLRVQVRRHPGVPTPASPTAGRVRHKITGRCAPPRSPRRMVRGRKSRQAATKTDKPSREGGPASVPRANTASVAGSYLRRAEG